jgi:hypothetical protein
VDRLLELASQPRTALDQPATAGRAQGREAGRGLRSEGRRAGDTDALHNLGWCCDHGAVRVRKDT